MKQKKEKILVIKLGALGDFIQALGPMSAIRAHHPDADITLLTTQQFIELGKQSGYFDQIWCDERPKFFHLKAVMALRKKLNGGGFSRVYDLQNNDRTGFYFRLFRVKPQWVGTAKGASHRNASRSRTAGSAFDGHLQTLKLAGIDHITIDDMAWIKGNTDHFKLPDPYILIVPGCAPSRPEKQWPAKHFGKVCNAFYERGFYPVIIGTENESGIAAQICKTCPHTVDLTGKTTIADIALLARGACAVLGNDTGPMHLIAPTGCPSYVLFSKHSNPEKHAPLGPFVKTMRSENLDDLLPEKVIDMMNVKDFKKTAQPSP